LRHRLRLLGRLSPARLGDYNSRPFHLSAVPIFGFWVNHDALRDSLEARTSSFLCGFAGVGVALPAAVEARQQVIEVNRRLVLVRHPAEVLRAEGERVQLVPEFDLDGLILGVIPGGEVFGRPASVYRVPVRGQSKG